ncbi:MAG: (2Fe-2S) ferredoxin domain-containing protein [Dehalococcoidia bacterium]|nr:(2Fe-2S) ferredoxin domain-containing protein [Dehalococcoidia bacterium]
MGSPVAKQVDRDGTKLPVLVCRGSDCRGDAQERLCESLCAAGVEVLITGCLGVCKGPVAVIPVGDRWEVVAKVRGKDARRRLLEAITRQRQKVVKSRTVRGSRRRKAIAKGAGKLARRPGPHARRVAASLR